MPEIPSSFIPNAEPLRPEAKTGKTNAEPFPGAETSSLQEKANLIHRDLEDTISKVIKSIPRTRFVGKSEKKLAHKPNLEEKLSKAKEEVIAQSRALLELIERFASGDLALTRDVVAEERLLQLGDKNTTLYSTTFLSEAKYFRGLVLIRTVDFIPSPNPKESRDQRIQFEVRPKPTRRSVGRSAIRIDYTGQLEYDLEVQLRGLGNVINRLRSSGMGKKRGHHFRSHVKIENGKDEFTQILELYQKKAEEQTIDRSTQGAGVEI